MIKKNFFKKGIVNVIALSDFENRLLLFLCDEYELSVGVELREEFYVLREKLNFLENGKQIRGKKD